jgi:site-specific DNA-methyltransferase (adenine-specific)/modification methylase
VENRPTTPGASLPLNQILAGNCLEWLQTLPEQSVDLIFADPPYNLQLQQELIRPNRSRVDAVNDDWDQFANLAEYDRFTIDWLTGCRRVLKDTGTLWAIGSYHNIYRVGAKMMDLGFWFLNDVIWHKTNPMPNFHGTRFTNATETLLWAKKSAAQKKYTFNYHAMKHLNEEKQMQNVWHIPLCTGPERIRLNGKKAHSTQKPEALLYRVILAASNIGDVILDPFFGSGTTGAVAKKLKRHYIGIEMDPYYIAVAQQRLADITDPAPDDTLLTTFSRRSLPRISIGQLLEARYLSIGQRLYSKNRETSAVLKADAQLQLADFTGSIHQTAAIALGQTAHNGWDFWYYEAEPGQLLSLDSLRHRYRQEFSGE